MTAFDDALADLHADPDLSVAADWRCGGQGPAVRLRVIRTVRDPAEITFGAAIVARQDRVHIRVSDAPQLLPGDTLTFDPDATPTIVSVTEVERDALDLTFIASIRRH